MRASHSEMQEVLTFLFHYRKGGEVQTWAGKEANKLRLASRALGKSKQVANRSMR